MTVLVDSNVILDILTNDPNWFDGSALQLTIYARQDQLAINPITLSPTRTQGAIAVHHFLVSLQIIMQQIATPCQQFFQFDIC